MENVRWQFYAVLHWPNNKGSFALTPIPAGTSITL